MHKNVILMLCNINKDVIMNLQLTSYRLKEIVLKPRNFVFSISTVSFRFKYICHCKQCQ